MANPRWTESSVPRSLPERVAQLYYAHGLFCATHPYICIVLALSLTLLCCYPLLNSPLPGNVPQQYASNGNHSLTEAPRWLQASSPVCFIQQVVMKTAVSPWSDDFLLTDAYRAPLAEVFSLVEVIQNYQHENSSLTLSDVCFHVESAKRKKERPVLPEYGCLLLSPANFWHQDVHQYTSDTNLISTIYSYQNFQKGKVSLSEVLFGLNMKDTGIKRYPLRKRQRIIQFAVTIVLRHYDKQFIDGLHDRLATLYPLHQKSVEAETEAEPPPRPDNGNSSDGGWGGDSTLHIFYPGEFNYAELAPLTSIYSLLFAYVYFFLRKIELVRSKVGIAVAAVITVASSLCVTVGICSFFGLELAGYGRGRESILLQMFPYLVVTVGFENVIVLTKSVVSTEPHLDVKIRIAQGLSREGWSMTKTLLIEVTIFTVGLLTLVPDIQEFCIFAIVGSLVDFFLQIFLFITFLGLDIREQADSPVEPTSYSSLHLRYTNNNTSAPTISTSSSPLALRNGGFPGGGGMSRSRSHPRLNSGGGGGGGGSSGATGGVGGTGVGGGGGATKIPKRLKLANFWARTRFVQHAFMLCMVVWIAGILYNAGMLQRFTSSSHTVDIGKPLTDSPVTRDPRMSKFKPATSKDPDQRAAILDMEKKFLASQKHSYKQMAPDDASSSLNQLKPSVWEPWQRVSAHHWSAVLALHNNTVHSSTQALSGGGYVTLLPSIRLAAAIEPQRALQLRNPLEKQQPPLQWHSLALALDPLEGMAAVGGGVGGGAKASGPMAVSLGPSPLLPSSPMELFLAMLLCLTSIMVVSYTVLVLYRCICSRNYAEWRSSWSPSEGAGGEGGSGDSEGEGGDVVLEAVPLVLSDGGHAQQVEGVASDGRLVASVCLAGELRCWDAATGELVVTVKRQAHFGGGARWRRHQACEPRASSSDDDGDAEIDTRRISKTEPDDDHLYHELAAAITGHNHENQLNHHHHHSSTTAAMTPMVVRNRHKNHHHHHRTTWDMPDLTSTINTNFSTTTNHNHTQQSNNNETNVGSGFDYGPQIRSIYEDFERDRGSGGRSGGGETVCKCGAGVKCGGRTLGGDVKSGGDVLDATSDLGRGDGGGVGRPRVASQASSVGEAGLLDNSPIWCIDCQDGLVVVGCANGRMEFWCGSTGQLKFVTEETEGAGLTCVKLVPMAAGGSAAVGMVVAARLNGSLDIYSLTWHGHGDSTAAAAATLHRRTHIRTGSAGSPLDWSALSVGVGGIVGGGGGETVGGGDHLHSSFNVVRTSSTRAHQQPITVLDVEGGRVLTGSQDHTLKVMSLLDQVIVYTLHGHCGPITALFIDRITPSTAGSASQDGMLCVWDLLTGACMYSLQAHDGCVTALTYSVSYIISLGADERLCVWERFQGHLLNTIQVSQTYCTSMVMLTHNLLITSKQGSLVVWDVRSGEPVRIVKLGYADNCLFVQHLVPLRMRNSVVCDYGCQLRIVRFPLV